MALYKLTQKQVRTLGEGLHGDGGNLYLLVRGNGRSWVFRYRHHYKTYELGLGSVLRVPLSKAREKAEEYRHMLGEGKIPGKDRAETKAEMARQLELRTAHFLKDFYKEAIEHYVKIKRLRGAGAYSNRESAVRMFALPYIGSKNIRSIAISDVAKALEPIWEERPGTANLVLIGLRACFSYAIMKGWFNGVPPTEWKNGLSMFLPPMRPTGKHRESLQWKDIPQFAAWLRQQDVPVTDLIFATLLCATRFGEFGRMDASDIDLENKVAYVRHRKDGQKAPFVVPLPEQALPFMEKAAGRTGLAFPSSSGKVFRTTSSCLLLKRSPLKTTVHGLRASFSTWCADHDKDPVIRELCLCHKVEGAVALAYQRSDRLEPRRKLLQEWADFVTSQIES